VEISETGNYVKIYNMLADKKLKPYFKKSGNVVSDK
jgi:hypothetical protein